MDPRFANSYHGNPQMGPDGVLRYPDGSEARPDGSFYNPPGEVTVSPLGSGRAGMTSPTMQSFANSNPGFGPTYGKGEVDPNRPPQGPYGSSNPRRDQKQQELADRNEARGRHPMTERSVGKHILTNPDNPRVTYYKRVGPDGRLSYYGRYEDPNALGGYQEFNPFTSRVSNQGDGVIRGADTYIVGKIEQEQDGDPSSGFIKTEGQIQMDPKTGRPKLDSSGHQAPVQNSNLHLSQAHFRDKFEYESNQEGTPAENSIRGSVRGSVTRPSPSPAMSAAMSPELNKPISEFTDIKEATDHLQKLYNKQYQLMQQGVNSQNSAVARALRQRAVQLDDHISKLKNKASQMPQDERDRRQLLDPDDPEKVWVIPEDTRPRMPDGSPSNNPNFPSMLPEQYEPYEYEGMERYDWNKDGVLNQTEYARWNKLKQQQAAGSKPGGRTSSTHMTPPDMMPGYALRGGFSSTGTQHQDTGGVNPNAPLFHGDGTMLNDPGLQPPAPAYMDHTPPTDLTTPGGIDHADNPPGYAPPAFPGDQATSDVSQQAQQLASSIANGEAIYRSILQNPQIPDAVKAKLAQLDANGNGYLSKKELKNADSILGDIGAVIDRGNLPRTGVLGRIAANRAERRKNRGR